MLGIFPLLIYPFVSRKQGFSVGTSRACCANLELPITYIQDKSFFLESPQLGSDGFLPSKRLYTTNVLSKFSVDRCSLSSQAGAESSGEEDDLEDGFSKLETPPTAEVVQASNANDENEDELVSGPEISDDEADIEPFQNELELSEIETDPNDKLSPRKRDVSALFKAILEFPGLSVHSALDKWVKEGNDLSRAEISLAMINLRRRRMFGRALQVISHVFIFMLLFCDICSSQLWSYLHFRHDSELSFFLSFFLS